MPAKPAGRPSNFVSDQHTLYCGWVMGLMIKAGLPFTPVVDDDGNFTNRVAITTTLSGVGITLLIPPPPDDWKFPLIDEAITP